MCAWSDCFVWSLTRAFLLLPGDRVGMPAAPSWTSPSSSSSRGTMSVADRAGHAGDHPVRPVPATEVLHERLACRRADGVLRADDVPAERLVAVEKLVVHALEILPRGVVVHVHLLDDHALLALDLLGVEVRVPEHVDQDVERDVSVLGGALDVVARVLLAGEGVELAADRVDLARDVARGRPPLRALEEHVLGEVRDPVRVPRLVARAGGEHDEARDRLRTAPCRRSGRAARSAGRSSRRRARSGSRRREARRLVLLDQPPPVVRDGDRLAGRVVEGDVDARALGDDPPVRAVESRTRTGCSSSRRAARGCRSRGSRRRTRANGRRSSRPRRSRAR